MALRQQSAIEFLSTYSFAIFIISLVLVAALAISISIGSNAPVYSTCTIQPLITCQQSLLTYNSVGGYLNFVLIFRNNLGFLLQFPVNAINLTLAKSTTGANAISFGACSPKLAGQGSQVICIVKVSGKAQLKQGANTYTQFRLTYGLCTNQTQASCTANTYQATGYSFQTLSPPYTNLYNVSIQSSNGVVIINGQSYFNNSVIYLPGGPVVAPYIIYAQPNSGKAFTSWTPGGGVALTSASTQNTFMTISANGNLIATFH